MRSVAYGLKFGTSLVVPATVGRSVQATSWQTRESAFDSQQGHILSSPVSRPVPAPTQTPIQWLRRVEATGVQNSPLAPTAKVRRELNPTRPFVSA